MGCGDLAQHGKAPHFKLFFVEWRAFGGLFWRTAFQMWGLNRPVVKFDSRIMNNYCTLWIIFLSWPLHYFSAFTVIKQINGGPMNLRRKLWKLYSVSSSWWILRWKALKGDLNLSGRAFGGHLDQNAPHGGQVSFGGAKGQHWMLAWLLSIAEEDIFVENSKFYFRLLNFL